MAQRADEFKEKFRPTDKLDAEIDQSLGDISMDDLYGFNKPQPPQGKHVPKGSRHGRVVSIDVKDDAVFVDFGSKEPGDRQALAL